MSKITIQKGDVKTTLRPKTEGQELITQTISDIKDSGLPTNEELDAFGDKLWDLLEISKKAAVNTGTEKLVETTQEVVNTIKDFVQEKNYDSLIQDIARKLKDGAIDAALVKDSTKENIKNDAVDIKNALKCIAEMIFDISKKMINDFEFRDMLMTILDITTNSYERAADKTSSLDIKEAIKSDIMTKPIPTDKLSDLDDTSRNTNQDYNKTGSNTNQESNVTGTNTEEVVKEKAKKFGQYLELTDQEKDDILRKVCAALLRLKKHPEYQPLVRNIFKLYDDMFNIWVQIENDPGLSSAYEEGESILHDIKKLLERASDMSLDHFITLVKKFASIRKDPLYIEVRKDVEDLLFNQPYETENDIKEKFEKIKNDLKALNDKFENVLDNLSNETKNIIYAIGHDTHLTNFTGRINQLVKDLFTDEHGHPTIEAATSSIGKVKDIFFPMIKSEFKLLAFPIIDIESKNYFFRIENFNLHLDHIIPDQLKIDTDSSIKIDLEKGKRCGEFNIRLKFDEITTKVKNLKFKLKKKTGIKYNDHGEVNISVKDATIDIAFCFKLKEDKVDKLEVTKVEVHLHGMKIDVLESRHEVIDSIITSVFMPVVRSNVTKQIEDGLHDILQEGLCKSINEGLKKLESN